MDPLVRQVRETIARWQLLRTGDRIVVGVSGGADSLCLLHVLREIAPEYALALHVGHLDHGLRGEESQADADHVRDLCARWGIPCTVERADVPALARAERLAIEEAARVARYRFLAQVAATQGAQTVAVAHHADDQAETVLMHLLRGAGMAGLRGMLPLSRLDEMRLGEDELAVPLRLLRPLLEVRRGDIDAYCVAHGLEPRFDRSNLDLTCHRNRLRHELLPLLETYNPNVREVLRRTAEGMAADHDLLRQLLDDAWKDVVAAEGDEAIALRRAAFAGQPLALQRGLLREAVHRLRRSLRNINWVHIEDARCMAVAGRVGARATLPGGLALQVGYDVLTVAPDGYRPRMRDLPRVTGPLALADEGETPLPGGAWIAHVSRLARQDLPDGWQRNADPYLAFVDARRLTTSICLRPRVPGDWVMPLGLAHRQKVGDLMTNLKVPAAERDTWPLLACGGDVIWVVGLRLDGRYAVSEDATEIVRVRLAHRTEEQHV